MAKFYSTRELKKFVEENKATIDTVYLGMAEDWSSTKDDVYDNGKFTVDVSKEKVWVRGIQYSIWATPTLMAYHLDGSETIRPCYFDDGKDEIHDNITRAKQYARITGGMDSIFDEK